MDARSWTSWASYRIKSKSPRFLSLREHFDARRSLQIRNLVTSAFKGSRPFRMYGATTQEIRDFIKDNFGRDIDRASLSPTLSRMRDESNIKGPDNSNKWRLGSD